MAENLGHPRVGVTLQGAPVAACQASFGVVAVPHRTPLHPLAHSWLHDLRLGLDSNLLHSCSRGTLTPCCASRVQLREGEHDRVC